MKKFLSIALCAAMLFVSMFAITASAEVEPIKDTSAPVTLKIHVYSTNDSSKVALDTDIDTDVTGDSYFESKMIDGSNVPIANIKFLIYSVDSAETDVKTANKTQVAYVVTDQNGTAVLTGDPNAIADAENKTQTIFATAQSEVYKADLAQGRYLVVFDKASSPASIDTSSVTIPSFFVDLPMTHLAGTDWLYTVDVYPKTLLTNSEPTVTKLVKDETTWGFYGDSATINAISDEKATWKITGTLPADISTYSGYRITDEIDDRLQVVTDAGIDVSASAKNFAPVITLYKSGQTPGTDTGTIANDFCTVGYTDADANSGTKAKIVVEFPNFPFLADYAGGCVTVEFKTVIKKGADNLVPAASCGVKIENATTIQYTNTIGTTSFITDDNDSSTAGNQHPYVYTGSLMINKTNSNTSSAITDKTAKFKLYKDSVADTNIVKKASSDTGEYETSNGSLTFTGLGAGVYYLVETVAPSGYELYGSAIKIEIGKVYYDGTAYGVWGTGSDGEMIKTQNVPNIPSTNLPLTGGMGIAIFAIAGIALVGAGLAVSFKSGKKGGKKKTAV